MPEGEGKLLLKQIRQISKEMLDSLIEIDDKLAKLQQNVNFNEEIDKRRMLEEINGIRLVIGTMEKEDTQEIEEEQILENLIEKLNKLINMTLGKGD